MPDSGRAYEVKNGRPSDIKKELDEVFKAYSLSSGTGEVRRRGAVRGTRSRQYDPGRRAQPRRIHGSGNLARKLDIPDQGQLVLHLRAPAHHLKYQRAEVVGVVIGQLMEFRATAAFGIGALMRRLSG